jgi:hypothetical protein
MAQEDDKGFFDKLGEIFNAPLPGTQRSGSQPQVPADDDDDDSLLERIKDVLQTPLPGTPQAESGNQTPGPASTSPAGQPTATGTVAPQSPEKTPKLDEDDLDEAWWHQDWAGFRAHQERERHGLELKQRRDQEKFAAYQQQESQRFHDHQRQELDAFTRQQQWRLNAWRQAVANSPGQKPPPPPWDMGPGAQMMPPGSPMPGPMSGPQPWMGPLGPGRRRS